MLKANEPKQSKPKYEESCEDCIHYAETSYMFGQCDVCKHEVACTAFCANYAERWTE